MKSVKLTRAGGLGLALMASTLSGCAFDAMDEDIVSVEKKSCGDHVLTSKKKPVLWSGTIEPGDPTADACGGNPCDSFPLQIDLPHNVWDRSGAVQVAVRWPNLFAFRRATNGPVVRLAEGLIPLSGFRLYLPVGRACECKSHECKNSKCTDYEGAKKGPKIWVGVFGYVWSLSRRLQKVEAEIVELESRRR